MRTILSLILALTLGACGDNPPAPPAPADMTQPAPKVELWASRPLVPSGPLTVSGGTLDGTIFTNVPNYQSCLTLAELHCVSFAARLPAPPPGYTLQVTPIIPVLEVAGQPAAFAPEGQPPCVEAPQVQTMWSTDLRPALAPLPGLPPGPWTLQIPPGASTLTYALCVRGETRVQLLELTGAIDFVPPRVDNGLAPQPLNPYHAPRDGGAAHD